jgi:hypothetical protein
MAAVANHVAAECRHRSRSIGWSSGSTPRRACSGLEPLSDLLAVAVAVSGSVLLVVSFVETGVIVALLATLTFATFAVLWFVLPIVRRGRDDY